MTIDFPKNLSFSGYGTASKKAECLNIHLIPKQKHSVMVKPQVAAQPHTDAHSIPHSGMGKRIGRVKLRKLMG